MDEWPLFFFAEKGREKGGRTEEGEGVGCQFSRESSLAKRGEGLYGYVGHRRRPPVYRGDVIRKHAGSTNLSQGMGRREGRGASNLVQRNEFSTQPLCGSQPLPPPHFPQGFIPLPLFHSSWSGASSWALFFFFFFFFLRKRVSYACYSISFLLIMYIVWIDW